MCSPLSVTSDMDYTVGSSNPLLTSTPKMTLKGFVHKSKSRLMKLTKQQETGLQKKEHIRKLWNEIEGRNVELQNYDRLRDNFVKMETLLQTRDQEINALKQQVARLREEAVFREQNGNQLDVFVAKKNSQIQAVKKVYKAKLLKKDRDRMCQDFKYRLAEVEIMTLQEDRGSLLQQVKLLKLENERLRRGRTSTDDVTEGN